MIASSFFPSLWKVSKISSALNILEVFEMKATS
jgi:hypothetical protein